MRGSFDCQESPFYRRARTHISLNIAQEYVNILRAPMMLVAMAMHQSTRASLLEFDDPRKPSRRSVSSRILLSVDETVDSRPWCGQFITSRSADETVDSWPWCSLFPKYSYSLCLLTPRQSQWVRTDLMKQDKFNIYLMTEDEWEEEGDKKISYPLFLILSCHEGKRRLKWARVSGRWIVASTPNAFNCIDLTQFPGVVAGLHPHMAIREKKEEFAQHQPYVRSFVEQKSRLKESKGEIGGDLHHRLGDCYFCRETSFDRWKRCSQCQVALYCDKNCQRRDWEKHRPQCRAPGRDVWGRGLKKMWNESEYRSRSGPWGSEFLSKVWQFLTPTEVGKIMVLIPDVDYGQLDSMGRRWEWPPHQVRKSYYASRLMYRICRLSSPEQRDEIVRRVLIFEQRVAPAFTFGEGTFKDWGENTWLHDSPRETSDENARYRSSSRNNRTLDGYINRGHK